MRVIVYHDYFGCETGCCGHTVELLDEGQDQYDTKGQFEFDHPFGASKVPGAEKFISQTINGMNYRNEPYEYHYHLFKGEDMPEEIKDFVRDMVIGAFGEEHCADIDWENCLVSDD